MLALIAVWALAEAVLFFIVADVPIMALGIRSGVKKALVGAGIAAVFAALGERFRFERVQYKVHACCHGTHAMIEALAATGLGPERIAGVAIRGAEVIIPRAAMTRSVPATPASITLSVKSRGWPPSISGRPIWPRRAAT